MTVLYRSGRQADALAAFRRARRVLTGDFGVDPSPALTEIHRQVLAHDPRLLPVLSAAPARRELSGTRPDQLPPAVPAFTGRGDEIARLDELVPGHTGAARPAAVVISAVSGTAGVGKTALAVHWARRVRHAFPDGQLYVNLRGFDPGGPAMSPAAAIKGFLDAFGVPPGRIPPGLEAQTGLYRSLLAGRRVLVLLDNARDAEQVRPPLPNAPGCLALVTSRNRLTSLAAAEGAHLLTVDLLDSAAARDLLTSRLGGHRVAAEPGATHQIVARCVGLPLALAIVAARAADQPHLPLATLAGELRQASGRLDALDGGDPVSQARMVFSWSYHALSGQAAALFRLLGLHPGPDATLPAVAGLAGLSLSRTRVLLAELTRGHLLSEPVPGRYTCHDLLRDYARELVATHDDHHTRQAATHRLLDHYLHTAHAADVALTPLHNPISLEPAQPGVVPGKPPDHQEALKWFTAERFVLLAAVKRAAAAGFDTHAWQLAAALVTFLDRQGYWTALAAAQTVALGAARRRGDHTGQATACRGLGLAQDRQGNRAVAEVWYWRALELFRALDNHDGQARTHLHLARMSADQGRFRQARHHARHSLHHYRAAGDRAGEAAALNHLGWCQAQLGDHRQALAHCALALAPAQEIGDLNGQAHTWDTLGYVRHQLGEHDQAIVCYQRAVELFHRTRDRHGEARCLSVLGDVQLSAGSPDAAHVAWTRALAITDELGLLQAAPLRARISGNPRAPQF